MLKETTIQTRICDCCEEEIKVPNFTSYETRNPFNGVYLKNGKDFCLSCALNLFSKMEISDEKLEKHIETFRTFHLKTPPGVILC